MSVPESPQHLIDRIERLERDLDQLRQSVNSMEKHAAVTDTTIGMIADTLKDIKSQVHDLRAVNGRISWLILSTLIAGVMGFILKGGLSVGP